MIEYNYETDFVLEDENLMIHGVLHYLGYKDKTTEEKENMRSKENECLLLLNT